MWQEYRFVAVLDQYELSDGIEVLVLRSVTHGGRPAWEAEGLDPLPAYAEAHLVRRDVGTGVCVRAREVGGPTDGQGHDRVLVHVVP